MNRSGVYWIYQKSNDRALYVGSSINLSSRIGNHKSMLKRGKHDNIHLQRIWNKYDPSDFEFMVLEECDTGRVIEREQFWKDAIDPVCNIGAIVSSPRLGIKCSDETRKKISEAAKLQKRDPLSEETKAKIGKAHLGSKRSAADREKMRMAHLGKPRPEWSDEAKNRFSDAVRVSNAGRVISDETREKMRQSHLGKKYPGKKYKNPCSPEECKRRSERMKIIWAKRRTDRAV